MGRLAIRRGRSLPGNAAWSGSALSRERCRRCTDCCNRRRKWSWCRIPSSRPRRSHLQASPSTAALPRANNVSRLIFSLDIDDFFIELSSLRPSHGIAIGMSQVPSVGVSASEVLGALYVNPASTVNAKSISTQSASRFAGVAPWQGIHGAQFATQVHWGAFGPQSRPPPRQVPGLPEKVDAGRALAPHRRSRCSCMPHMPVRPRRRRPEPRLRQPSEDRGTAGEKSVSSRVSPFER